MKNITPELSTWLCVPKQVGHLIQPFLGLTLDSGDKQQELPEKCGVWQTEPVQKKQEQTSTDWGRHNLYSSLWKIETFVTLAILDIKSEILIPPCLSRLLFS